MYGKALTPEDMADCGYGTWANQALPLDCLTPKQRQVIEMTLYEGLEQAQIAERMKSSIPTVAIHLKRAKGRLEEFGKARKILEESNYEAPSRVIDYYLANRSQRVIADREGVSKQAVEGTIRKWRVSNSL